jgi:hypothetical protein
MTEEKPSEITFEDIETLEKMMKHFTGHTFQKCNWCDVSYDVREVGPNYICADCEKEERKAGRFLVFTSPVRDAYFKFMSEDTE